jgi:hypothetical protein
MLDPPPEGIPQPQTCACTCRYPSHVSYLVCLGLMRCTRPCQHHGIMMTMTPLAKIQFQLLTQCNRRKCRGAACVPPPLPLLGDSVNGGGGVAIPSKSLSFGLQLSLSLWPGTLPKQASFLPVQSSPAQSFSDEMRAALQAGNGAKRTYSSR